MLKKQKLGIAHCVTPIPNYKPVLAFRHTDFTIYLDYILFVDQEYC